MTFILIGNRIVNMMCVVKVEYWPPVGAGCASRLSVLMLAGDPLVFTGGEADLAWSKFAKMGTPLEAV